MSKCSLTGRRCPLARVQTQTDRGSPRRGWNRARCWLRCSAGTRASPPAMLVPARVRNGAATRVSTSASSDEAETWAPGKEKLTVSWDYISMAGVGPKKGMLQCQAPIHRLVILLLAKLKVISLSRNFLFLALAIQAFVTLGDSWGLWFMGCRY